MTEVSTGGQLACLAASVLLGAAAGVGYDLIRLLRGHAPPAGWLLELMWAPALTLALFRLALTRGDGLLPLYTAAGAAVGGGLYAVSLSSLVRRIGGGIWDGFAAVLRRIHALFFNFRRENQKVHEKNRKNSKKSLFNWRKIR